MGVGFAYAGIDQDTSFTAAPVSGGQCLVPERFGNRPRMTHSMRRILIGGVFFAITCLTAVAGYMIAGWSFLDAVYMVIITVFGVGYGETQPLASSELKVFTMGLIVAGCSSGIYVVGGFVHMLAEG